MTIAAARPQAPRRVATLLTPFLIIVSGFVVGALIPGPWGAVAGVLAAVAVIAGLRQASIEINPAEGVALALTMFAATVLTVLWLDQTPLFLTPFSALRLGGVWLIAGLGTGALAKARRGVGTAVNIALLWAGAGALAVPMAATMGFLDLESVGLSGRVAVLTVVAVVGGSVTLSGITGVRALGVIASLIVISMFAAAQVGFSVLALINDIGRMSQIPNFWPPDFSWAIGTGTWWWLPSWDFGSAIRASPLIETFRIAILAALIGCVTALPVAFMASTITAPDRLTYLLNKGFMNVIRTIPDLFWAMFFVAAVSIGPLAGVLALIFFSLAIMAKLLSETVDAVDPGPLEAARATGSSHFPAIRMSVLPQVLPNYVAYALYIFELNIRASVVLGLVGAGGIGRVMEAQRAFFRFDRVLAIVIIIFVIVFVVEQISVGFRRRLV